MAYERPQYGRRLDDFSVGEVYDHPWSVTVDHGMVALWQSSFLDANALYSSDVHAERLGLGPQRVVPHALVLNLGLSFSVHDVSQQAIAHLAYIDVRFPRALHPGDTFTAFSEVLGVKPSTNKPDRGTVHVRTVGLNQRGEAVLVFERKALIRAGTVSDRPKTPVRTLTNEERQALLDIPHAPSSVYNAADGFISTGQPFFAEDFSEGQVICHDAGRTVGESEHMMLSGLVRNTHPLHWDHGYCEEHSFKKERIVYGGLVLSWTLAMASWDTSGNAVWELGLDDGAHPAPVLAGDTVYAASQVLSVGPVHHGLSEVVLRTVGVKNTHSSVLIKAGKDLFTAERNKADKTLRVPEKVVEITRRILVVSRQTAC